MAVTGPESRKSKKSKHKKSPSKTVINNSISGSAPVEQDESETDLDKPMFKLPHHHRTVSKSKSTNGDVSDSETDVDKPPKRTVFHEPVREIQSVKHYNNTQSAEQQSDEDEESDDEQQSMSLLQFHPAKLSEKISNQSNVNRSPKSGHSSLPSSGSLKNKVIRKPSVPEISSSESESDSNKETDHLHHSQLQRPQSQPESESEDESEEEKRTSKTSQINQGTRTELQPESVSGSEEESEEEKRTPKTSQINQGTRTELQLESVSGSEEESEEEKRTPKTSQINQGTRTEPQPESESGSEEESEEEKRTPKTSQINQGTRTEPQPESESGSEEEEDEQNEQREENRNRHRPQQQFVSAPFVKIKEEFHSNSESSSFEEDDPPPLQEFQNTSLVPPEQSRISSQSASTPQNPRGDVINKNHSSSIATFEQEHTRISAPVIEIPQDSRVWVLQVPRSIEAIHLHGQYLPKKLKGGEVLNLPSGRWQIMEQPNEASRSTLNCIVSTGNFSYGMRWLQPRGFWFFKHLRSPLQMKTTDAPWTQEITPLPIKELLKKKSNTAITKDQHLKPSKKRHQNLDLDLPNKWTKMIREGDGIIHQLFVERKRKVQLFNNSSSIVDIEPSMMELSSKKDESMHKKVKHNHRTSEEGQSSIQEGEAGKGKKRKRSSEVNETRPNKEKKKHSSEVYDQSHLTTLPQLQSVSVDDVNRSMTAARAENISFSKKEKKKSKHKEICDESLTGPPVPITKVKPEITENDNLSGSSSDKKQKRHKKSNVEQEVEDTFLEIKQNESREISDKEKKKKGKRRSHESVQGETFQANEKKIELAFPTNSSMGTEKRIKKEKKHSQESETSFETPDTEVRKKKKHKHKNKGEGEVPDQETEEDISVKKKKKHKHKEFDVPKVKQENFWERDTSPDFLRHLYLTQATPEDK